MRPDDCAERRDELDLGLRTFGAHHLPQLLRTLRRIRMRDADLQ